MRKRAVVCGLFVLFVAPAFTPLLAQRQQPPADQSQAPSDQSQSSSEQTQPSKAKRKYVNPKYELSGGYALRNYYSPNGNTLHMNGWYASFDYNWFSWFGVTGETVGTYHNEGGLNGDTNIYTLLIGPQFYPLRHRKLTPFGHFLYGAGWYRNSVGTYGGFPGRTVDTVVSSWELGGGLDLALKGHWGVRVVQIDTTHADFHPNTSSFTNRSLFRFSAGITYHFGQR